MKESLRAALLAHGYDPDAFTPREVKILAGLLSADAALHAPVVPPAEDWEAEIDEMGGAFDATLNDIGSLLEGMRIPFDPFAVFGPDEEEKKRIVRHFFSRLARLDRLRGALDMTELRCRKLADRIGRYTAALNEAETYQRLCRVAEMLDPVFHADALVGGSPVPDRTVLRAGSLLTRIAEIGTRVLPAFAHDAETALDALHGGAGMDPQRYETVITACLLQIHA